MTAFLGAVPLNPGVCVDSGQLVTDPQQHLQLASIKPACIRMKEVLTGLSGILSLCAPLCLLGPDPGPRTCHVGFLPRPCTCCSLCWECLSSDPHMDFSVGGRSAGLVRLSTQDLEQQLGLLIGSRSQVTEEHQGAC